MAKKLFVFFMALMMVLGAATFAGCGRNDDETSVPQRPITGDEVGETPDTGDKNEGDENPDAGDKNEGEGNPDAGDKNEGEENPDTGDKNEDEEDHSKDLVISFSSLTTDAQFFGITVDGTYMEVIAYKYDST